VEEAWLTALAECVWANSLNQRRSMLSGFHVAPPSVIPDAKHQAELYRRSRVSTPPP
jgi:hypothetical protein